MFGVTVCMTILTYSTKLICDSDSKAELIRTLELERKSWNLCMSLSFGSKNLYLKAIHDKCYKNIRIALPNLKSNYVSVSENSVLSALRTIRSNNHLCNCPVKKRLSAQLNRHLYKCKEDNIFITTQNGRVKCSWVSYPKLENAFQKGRFCDPKIFVRNGDLYIAFVFEFPEQTVVPSLALGVDLGYRRYAATSEGKLFIDKEYNARKRKARYLKRCLQRTKTRSAKRHLKKVKNKERNQSKDFNHNLCNQILKTEANVIALEDLKVQKMQKRKHKGKSRSRKGQMSLSELRRILTYKAGLVGKLVVCVNPMNTSRRDSVTGKLKGVRKGCRFYAESGLVYDSDVNAAVNIAKLTKLPISRGNLLDGQAVVNRPYARHLSGKLDALTMERT